MRNLLYTIVPALAVFLVFMTGQAQAGAVRSWADVPQLAMTENGKARVIVEFTVADYASLSRTSREATPDPKATGASRADGVQAMAMADAALIRAITNAGDAILSGLPAADYKINRRHKYVPMVSMEVTPDTLARLAQDPRVKKIHANTPTPLPEYGMTGPGARGASRAEADQGPDSPQLDATVGIIGAESAWAQGYTGEGIHVAILDSGIRPSHEMFAGKDIQEACFSLVGHCPGNTTEAYGPGAAAHYPNTHDGYDHGTHVAGIATGNNGELYGVAKDADIIAVNVFSKFSGEEYCVEGRDPCVLTYPDDQISALGYIYGLRATYTIGAVNMSLGGGEYTEYCNGNSRAPAIDMLTGVKVPVVISSGNNGYCEATSSPGCIENAVTVSASDDSDVEAYFANWHTEIVDLFAPGVDIYSATGESDTSYAGWDGTSMSAPHVSGAFALQRQYSTSNTVRAMLRNLTSQGPEVSSVCPVGGSKPRVYADDFRMGVEGALPGAIYSPLLLNQ